jgi:hypothetical protein
VSTCGHDFTIWKERISELREHLCEHRKVADVDAMTDDQVRACYMDAKRIFLEGIPEDADEDDLEDEESDNG